LKLPNAIATNMVLQRSPLAAVLWGWANMNDTVKVELDGKLVAHTLAALNGSWHVELPVQKAGNGHSILIADSFDQVVLSNIAFGDVWLCSGQSNMEFSTNDAFNASLEIADSIQYTDLRLYTIKDTAANEPQYDGQSKTNYRWGVSGPAAFQPVGGGNFSWFSATCYFFGRDLYIALNGKVPIGLVASDWGGQKVEAFSSPDALNDPTCGGTVKVSNWTMDLQPNVLNMTYTPLERLSLTSPDGPNPTASQLWYGQIYPFLPMRFTGATWYQGESNAGDPQGYACRFPAMIADWRLKFNLPNLSFFFVQLAAFQQDYSEIRQAQMAALKLPKTGYAVAIDLGDPTSPQGSIHPRRKQEVGRRLALATQKVQYGMPVVSEGPIVESHSFDGNKVTIMFRADTAINLHMTGTAACSQCCNQSSLELQTADGKWNRAPMTIHTDTHSITSFLNTTQKLIGVRFDWEGYPQCALYNGIGGPDNHTGLAAPPFSFSPPPPPPVSWRPVFRQTLPELFKPGKWSVNPSNPNADTFSILDKLENMRNKRGGYNFKLRWADPDLTETMHWKQTNNPFITRKSGVVGYEAVNVSHTENNWGGLEFNADGECLMDGSMNTPKWFYCVGYFGLDWGYGLAIPSFSRPAYALELFVMDPKSSTWVLVFRQTLPHRWRPDQWSLNEHDPYNESYAILDQLETFRNPTDGKLELKMNWPDRYNTWFQTSNPVRTTGVQGYEAIDVQFTAQNWGGLESNNQTTLLDGSIGVPLWFYSIGYFGSDWTSHLIPAYSVGAYQAELFVQN